MFVNLSYCSVALRAVVPIGAGNDAVGGGRPAAIDEANVIFGIALDWALPDKLHGIIVAVAITLLGGNADIGDQIGIFGRPDRNIVSEIDHDFNLIRILHKGNERGFGFLIGIKGVPLFAAGA